MQQDDSDMPDLPLHVPSTGSGKLKGGPKKRADVKPTKTKAPSLPKAKEGKSGGGFKAGKPGKISAKIGHTSVKSGGGGRKAPTQFSLPKPSLPKSITPSSKIKRR